MKLKIDCNWHKFVDLGLPSGLLWATCNVGANEPWENGLYFSWGNVDGHKKLTKYDFGTSNGVPYESTPGGKLTTDIPVDAGYDAAHANFGGSWRMPTKDEFQELDDNCTSEWTIRHGVNGRLFTSMINGNSVFFPAVGFYYGTILNYEGVGGCYWSSSFRSQTIVYYLTFGSKYLGPQSHNLRFYGFPVRPVLDHPKDSLLIKTIKR